MSSLFAYFGNDLQQVKEKFNKAHPFANVIQSDSKSVIAYQALSKNILFDLISSPKKWIVSGIGILNQKDKIRLAKTEDWKDLLNNQPQLNKMEGHYFSISWDDNNIQVMSDSLGLRDIYMTFLSNGIILTTRVDWIAIFKEISINFFEFGSRWLTFNQISTNSIVKDVVRICKGQTVIINRNDFSVNLISRNSDHFFENVDKPESEFDKLLEKYIAFPIKDSFKLSLSLSGGLDSRVILAYLLNLSQDNWNTHTFGCTEHPDSLTATEMAKVFNFSHDIINRPFPSFDEALEELKEYSCASIVNNSASSIIQLRNYQSLNSSERIIIDGGFGEIWRREFLYGLQLKGKNQVYSKNAAGIFNTIKLFRANIFNEEINSMMENGCIQQLNELIEFLPEIKDIKYDHWLDLFALNTRLPNYYGHEQSILDNIVKAYMPFVQPSLLSKLFEMSVGVKRNGKLFKQIIKEKNYSLSKIHLVKGVVESPFFLNSLQSRMYSRIQKKFNKKLFVETNQDKFLDLFKEFIFDIINSQQVKNCEYYNYSKILEIADNYFKGDKSFANQLDWWLSFEIFKEQISKRN